MKRALPAICLILPGAAVIAVLAADGRQPLTTADLSKLRSVGDVQLTADGGRIAYTIQNSDRTGPPYSQI